MAQPIAGIEEISLTSAPKLLHRGTRTVVSFVEQGRLPALVDYDARQCKRYRFRLSDIKEFQQRRAYRPASAFLPTADELARDIFG